MTVQYMATICAGVLGASGVGLGAFGAHALKEVLVGPKAALWQTASQYHLLHAVALAAAAALMQPHGPQLRPAAALVCLSGLSCGTVLFSGSLYALALGAPRMVGAVTPVGGLLLIVGWLMLVVLAR